MYFAFTRSLKQMCTQLPMSYLLIALLVLAQALTSQRTWAQGAGYWHTSGSKILDSNGDEVRMAGINWYGFETPDYIVHGLWAQDYHTVLNTIKSLGYNVIRIPFSNELVESNPVPSNYTTYADGGPVNQALYGQTALADLDTIVSYAGSIGLRVILDNHRSEAGETNEANGLWYTSAYPQSNWIADWETMATRYSASKFTFNGNPTVIGFDLRNEPHLSGSGATTGSCWTGDTSTNGCPVTLTSQNWPVAAEAAGNAVLAINPKLLIFVEGNDCYSGVCGWQGGNLIGVANYPVKLNVANQLVYSAHDYGPNLYQQTWFNGSTTAANLDATWNKYWGYISADGTAPVWLGEFGTDNTSTDIENTAPGSQGQWFESLVGYLQNNPSINWTYWALNGEDTYGLLDGSYDATPGSALKQSELESIQFPLGGTPSQGFAIKSSVSALSVAQGGNGTATITITDAGGFNGGVSLAASGLPNGVTAAFSVNPATSTSLVTFSVSPSAPQGSATVTITGSSGALVPSTAAIALTVGPPVTGAGFTLTSSPASLSVAQGKSGTDTIKITDVGGFAGSVAFAITGLPSGVTASFSPLSSTSSSVLTLTASTTATLGTVTVTITGTSGNATAKTSIVLNVTNSTQSFTLAASTATLAVTQGKTATDTITVADSNGFTGNVMFAAAGLPTGVTASFSPTSSTSSTAMTLTASTTATPGTATVTITGTSGSLSATTSITVTVTPSGGGGCTIDYTISPQNSTAFGANITIVNGPTAITSWTLSWSFANGQTVSSLWNGNVTQSGANVTVTNESYNGSIAAGGSLTGIGFNGTWNGVTNAVPASFSLNGTACTVN
ncbi:MAG TPA: cellulase family glycosylhydrolase [Terracidiphilus sp.]